MHFTFPNRLGLGPSIVDTGNCGTVLGNYPIIKGKILSKLRGRTSLKELCSNQKAFLTRGPTRFKSGRLRGVLRGGGSVRPLLNQTLLLLVAPLGVLDENDWVSWLARGGGITGEGGMDYILNTEEGKRKGGGGHRKLRTRYQHRGTGFTRH